MKTSLEALDDSFAGYDRADEHQRFSLINKYVHTLYESCAEDGFRYALLLVAAIGEGTNPKTLADFTGMPLDFVNAVADRMTTAEMWLSDGSVDYEFLGVPPGEYWKKLFAMDVLVAQGLIAAFMRSGVRLHRMTEAGVCAVEHGWFERGPTRSN